MPLFLMRVQLGARPQDREAVPDRADAEVGEILPSEQAEGAPIDMILAEARHVDAKAGVARQQPLAHLLLAPAVERRQLRLGRRRITG